MKQNGMIREQASLDRKELSELLASVTGLDSDACEAAWKRWDSVAKPLRSLGVLEEAVVQAAGIYRTSQVDFRKKAVVIMCADNGIVEEGISQTGKEVTAIVTRNFTYGESCVCLMADEAGADVFPVDIGVAEALLGTGNRHPLLELNIRRGTRNFLKEPALTERETIRAVRTGIELVRSLKNQGYGLIATGEMGIGNTTTSSAAAAAVLKVDPYVVTGRGAGLDSPGLLRKISVIRQGLSLHKPDPEDGIDILSKVGGLDLAGLTGIFLGGARYRIPVIIDGFISGTAALLAQKICPASADYMLASHVSSEPAGKLLLEALHKKAAVSAGLCLGEGTGAVAFMPLLDMALRIYREMSTFCDIKIEDYKPLT